MVNLSVNLVKSYINLVSEKVGSPLSRKNTNIVAVQKKYEGYRGRMTIGRRFFKKGIFSKLSSGHYQLAPQVRKLTP